MSAFWRGWLRLGLWRRLLLGVAASYIGVSLSLGGTRAAVPVFQALAATWTLIVIAAHFRPSVSSVQARLKQTTRWALCLELVASNVLLTIVLAELALRAFAALTGSSLLLDATLAAHRLVPGHDYGGGLRGNQGGYPGRDFVKEKRPGVFRIAALGDSFAVGPAVAFADNYLTLLETRLPGVEVYNFGVSGAGPREYLAILRRDVWTYEPDLVLLSIFVGNDITETLPTARYMDPRQHSVYLLLTRGWRLLREESRQVEDFGRSAERLPPRGLAPATFAEVEGRRLAVCLRQPSDALEKKWQRALAHLDGIVSACRSKGVPLAVVPIPDEFQVEPHVLALALQEAGVRRAEVDLELPQRRLTTFFAERGVPCLDLLPAFAKVPDAYAPRDTHWNERGNQLAADTIAAWLREIRHAR